jgi:hypothetical protein
MDSRFASEGCKANAKPKPDSKCAKSPFLLEISLKIRSKPARIIKVCPPSTLR